MTPAAFIALSLLAVAAVGITALAMAMADRTTTPALLGAVGFVAVLASLI
jgi:hypothetical protein